MNTWHREVPEEEHFPIRSYGIGELAHFYCPSLTVAAARRKMMTWIHLQPDLVKALAACGFSQKARCLTPSQVKLIVEALGEP